MTPTPTLAGRAASGALIALLVLSGCTVDKQKAEPQDEAQTSTAPGIFFRAPLDGATVGPTFRVEFGLRNYGVAPAGVPIANTGHFHILIDVEPPPTGEIIPADSLHRHFGGGQIETSLTLAPGPHTLRLVLADADHRVIGPALVSAPIRVVVRAR
jgi:hypothetical protein